METDGTQASGHELDLTNVVTRLNRIRSSTRSRLANSDLTRAFLTSAVALLEERFGSARPLPVPEDAFPFSFLTRARVLRRAQDDFPELLPTEAKFRDRWAGQQDFLFDVVSYSLAARRQRHREILGSWVEEALVEEADFVGAVYRLARLAFGLLSGPEYRLQLLAVAWSNAYGADDAVKDVFAASGRDLVELCGRIAARYGLELRPGVSLDDYVLLVSALAEGMSMRMLADADGFLADVEGQRELFATGCVALMMSLVDVGDGLTVEDAAGRRVKGSRSRLS
ncbi:hypothetical protein SPF06_04005 [Sinomonas sp. JGH33]|uniref:Tetracyclin repressor-like C-terminal domain-containing protein n=1 Tax=Sinomonas terricola TaxID=3110330 RepID=A0ABU5T2L8_9MICC|nr:hypothetical protein [Sinomonas sp. JGH33]MEA5453878.1 hypothetical protein [Sinomonas sp. JGH33]